MHIELDRVNDLLLDRFVRPRPVSTPLRRVANLALLQADTVDPISLQPTNNEEQMAAWKSATATPFDPLEAFVVAQGRYVRCPRTLQTLYTRAWHVLSLLSHCQLTNVSPSSLGHPRWQRLRPTRLLHSLLPGIPVPHHARSPRHLQTHPRHSTHRRRHTLLPRRHPVFQRRDSRFGKEFEESREDSGVDDDVEESFLFG